MKKFRKLIPALCMLLVSALFVGTSTYAWFSMNTQVKASDMSVTAKSNATYLLISKDATVATDKTKAEANNEAVFNGNAVEVYPTAFVADAAGKKLTDELTIAQYGWYTANNKNSSNATDAVFNYKAVDTTDNENFGKYVRTSTMYLTLSADSEAWAKYVKVSVAKDANNDASASIILKVTNGTNTIYITGNEGYIDCTTANLTNNGVIKVEAYTYIDGTSTNVYSDFKTIDKLTGKFTLTFDLVENNA